MNGYQPEKRCSNCLAFNICKKKYKNQVCKKYKERRPVPPSPNAHLYAQTQTPTYTPPPMPEIKQPRQRTVLSVRDFAILYNIANESITNMEKNAQRVYGYMLDCPYSDSEREMQEKIQIENNMKELQSNPCYQDLLRIREKLGGLNIEVETPSVGVEDGN